jgi:N-methylhydantoinase A
VRQLEEAYGREHERTYGHRAGADEPVELVGIHVIGRGLRPGTGIAERVMPSRTEAASPAPRRAYFGPAQGWIETPVLRRADLATPRTGPLIIEEYDATCLVLPGWRASLDTAGNIALEQ